MLVKNPLYQLRLHKERMYRSVNTTTTTKITQSAFEESEFSKILKNYQLQWKKTLLFSTCYCFQLLPKWGKYEDP